MQSISWELIGIMLILLFCESIANNLYISLALLVRVTFHFTDSKEALQS